MRFLKSFFLTTFLFPILSLSVCASEWKNLAQECSPDPFRCIHTVKVVRPGFGAFHVYMWTSLGREDSGVCVFEKDTPPVLYELYNTANYLCLSGTKLKEIGGEGYTCAATNIQCSTGGQIFRTYFQLISDPDGNYTSTNPDEIEVDIGSCMP